MDIRGKLFTKILGWFFLNLALIGVLVWGVQALQLDPGAASTRQDEFRVQAAAKLIADQLIKERPENWDAVLQQHADLHKVTFVLMDSNSVHLAGPPLDLPEPVREELQRIAQRPPVRRPNPNSWIYNELNLTPQQIAKYESARSQREQAYRQLWGDPEFRNLPREERNRKFSETRAAITRAYMDELTGILTEEQRGKYTNIVQRFNRVSGLTLRRVPGPLSPDRLSRVIAEADANSDGQLTTNELRDFLRIPPGAGAPLPRPPNPPGSVIIPPLRTANPTRHWAGVEIPVRVQTGTEDLLEEDLDLNRLRRSRVGRRGQPPQTFWMATLLTMSESGGGQGIFAERLPWITIVLAAVGLSALFWLPMVRNITRPIAEVTAATEQIAEGKFDTRVGTARTDEIGRVGQAVNFMADRLDGFVKGQRRFLGDISHELCSPIARIQAALSILGQRTDAEQKKYVQDVQEEVEHMSELVNELLLFSQEDVKPRSVELEPIPLRTLVDQVVARECDDTPPSVEIAKDLRVQANARRLTLAVGNLLRNAMQYAGKEGPITVSAEKSSKGITLRVADCGPGLPEECLPRIFDPFYRPEPSRGRDTGGVGLGLAIVKTCVDACGGTVTCRNRKPTGLEFKIVLEAAEDAA